MRDNRPCVFACVIIKTSSNYTSVAKWGQTLGLHGPPSRWESAEAQDSQSRCTISRAGKLGTVNSQGLKNWPSPHHF